MSKTLVIGDIHGCYNELQALLDAVSPSSDDQIICVGDLVDRGPAPQDVVRFFIDTPNAVSVRGNREDKHILAYDGKLGYGGSRGTTRYQQFNDEDAYAEAVAYMRTMPLYLDLPDALVVHAYYVPGVPLPEQEPDILMGHDEIIEENQTWYTEYNGGKPLLFGHREYPILHYKRRVFALDTRCVYGGTLTGLLLPDCTLHSVPARRDHYTAYRAKYGG